MLLLSETQIDWHVANRNAYLLGGLAMASQPFWLPQGFRFGVLIGFVLLSLSIYAFVLRRWRTEPGLWMLALVIVVGWTPGYFLFEWKHIVKVLDRVRAMQQQGAFDFAQLIRMLEIALGLSLMGTSILFAISVAIQNWKRTRRPVLPTSGANAIQSPADLQPPGPLSN
jgi:hypothetical protein